MGIFVSSGKDGYRKVNGFCAAPLVEVRSGASYSSNRKLWGVVGPLFYLDNSVVFKSVLDARRTLPLQNPLPAHSCSLCGTQRMSGSANGAFRCQCSI